MSTNDEFSWVSFPNLLTRIVGTVETHGLLLSFAIPCLFLEAITSNCNQSTEICFQICLQPVSIRLWSQGCSPKFISRQRVFWSPARSTARHVWLVFWVRLRYAFDSWTQGMAFFFISLDKQLLPISGPLSLLVDCCRLQLGSKRKLNHHSA